MKVVPLAFTITSENSRNTFIKLSRSTFIREEPNVTTRNNDTGKLGFREKGLRSSCGSDKMRQRGVRAMDTKKQGNNIKDDNISPNSGHSFDTVGDVFVVFLRVTSSACRALEQTMMVSGTSEQNNAESRLVLHRGSCFLFTRTRPDTQEERIILATRAVCRPRICHVPLPKRQSSYTNLSQNSTQHRLSPRGHNHDTRGLREHLTRGVHTLDSSRGEEQPALVSHIYPVHVLYFSRPRHARQKWVSRMSSQKHVRQKHNEATGLKITGTFEL